MPKGKKVKPNGFYHFMVELKNTNPAYRHLSMNEMPPKADPLWQQLSQERKKYYNEMAKNSHDTKSAEKFTSDGQSVSLLTKQLEEQDKLKKAMKENIERVLDCASILNKLPEEVFLIMHINHLCYFEQSNTWFICEIAIVPFSLRDGIAMNDIFYKLVKPGTLPLGYRSEAKAHSDLTHKLEPVALDSNEGNMEEVYNDLLHYLRKYEKDQSLPYVYTSEKMLEMPQIVMENFNDEFPKYGKLVKVYSLQYLFFKLKNKVHPNAWPTITFSFTALDRDPYTYTNGIACEYHELGDVTIHCSKSIAIRQAYNICDYCCADLGIALVPGLHLPLQAKVPQQNKAKEDSVSLGARPRSTASSYKSARSNPSSVDLDYDNNASAYMSQDDTYSICSNDTTYQDNFPSLGGSQKSSQRSNTRSYSQATNSQSSASVTDAFGDLNISGRSSTSDFRFPNKRTGKKH